MSWLRDLRALFRLVVAGGLMATVRASSLVRDGRGEDAAVMEADAGLPPGAYENRSQLAQRLEERLQREKPDWAAQYVSCLSGVDWLWLVSCSIGRVEENGDRDVEGFCVRLAVHRARSVAAFRWPVHALEAACLVNESVRLFLHMLKATAAADRCCLRARALNDARKSFFGDGLTPPLLSQVGLGTAAACELFGLG